MSILGSSSSIQDSSTDYELIQPRIDRLRRGYSTRDPLAPPAVPPHHIPSRPRKPQLPANIQRLSASRRRNYADLQGRQPDSEYDVPRPYAVSRESETIQRQRYDGFFRGSILEGSEEEEEEGEGEGEQAHTSLILKKERCCKCGCAAVIKTVFFFVLILTLFISLAALGLAVYSSFFRHGSSTSMDHSLSNTAWCDITVTMAEHAENCTVSSSTYCITEALSTNITGLTPLRFHCEATHCTRTADGETLWKHSYNNTMYRDSESVYCECQFDDRHIHDECSVVGRYCLQGQKNSTI